MDTSKKVAVITGAASGIGLELARACLDRNMHVVMMDSHVKHLKESAQQLRQNTSSEILEFHCDVRDFDAMQATAKQIIQHFTRVDLLFNNAGISGKLAPLWELARDEIQTVMDVNINGVINGVLAFLPYLFQQACASKIINMASLYGLCSGSLLASYSMTKHAVLALSESLYFDLHRLNKAVDVAVVCPSFARTGLLNQPSTPDGKMAPLQQLVGTLIDRSRPPEEIANLIMDELDMGRFYILPDKEVKDYCEQRARAILNQDKPHRHSLEKIITVLSERVK